jgi:hypothetical protein
MRININKLQGRVKYEAASKGGNHFVVIRYASEDSLFFILKTTKSFWITQRVLTGNRAKIPASHKSAWGFAQ